MNIAALAGQEAPELQQEYLGAEFRVAQMLTDIQKIIVDGVRDCFPAAEPEEHK
ncbi:MAG: hypothetical protein PHC60_06570 [Heliobacteriaceae bacterium]|nr:hypothetical protein [Heliobacteriaceae bacterium]MDD4588031.1 hypothetical protein [Heliobacteriaceae bacterium]